MGTNRRFSRRTLVTGSAATAAFAALQGRGARAHDGQKAPVLLRYAKQAANIPTPREQTVVISRPVNQVWDSFNPYIPNGEAYSYGVNQICREAMFYVNFEQGEVINHLATGFEYNADFTEMTISLNPNAKWNDGQPYTADDVVFSLDLMKNNSAFNGSAEANDYIAGVTAANPQTVVFALSKPNPRFHYNFFVGIVGDRFRVVPKHVWETQDAGTFANNPPVYTGPYVLEQAIPEQFMQVWRKNPDYWNAANLNPTPEFVIFRQSLPPDAEAQEFINGNVDIPGLPYLNQEAVRGQYDNWIQFAFDDPCPRGIWLNQDSPSGLFATAEGRWAISYLLDRQTIGQTIWQPPTEPAQYPWAPWGLHDRWTNEDIRSKYAFEFDIDRANQLLDSIGSTRDGDTRTLNGQPLALSVITPGDVASEVYQIAALLAQDAAEVGIQMDVKSLLGTPFSDAWHLGEFDISSHWLCGVALDPNQLYTQFLTADYKPIGERSLPARNVTRNQIPELNDIALQLELVNPEDPANKALFDQGLEAYLKHLPAMPSVYTIFTFAFNTRYWTGWPTPDNKYNIAANWWAQFLFVIGQLQPVAQ